MSQTEHYAYEDMGGGVEGAYQGVVVATDAELAAMGYLSGSAPAAVITDAMVEEERDRRVELGFDYMGATFHMDAASRANILATFAAAMDKKETHVADGTLLAIVLIMPDWSKPGENFKFGAMGGVNVNMNLGETLDFGRAAKVFYEEHIFAARALKATQGGIPADYKDDSHWP